MIIRHLLNLSRRSHRLLPPPTTTRSASTAAVVSTQSPLSPPHPNQLIYDRISEQVKSKLKRLENPNRKFLKHNSPFPVLSDYTSILSFPETRVTTLMDSNRLCIRSLESRVSRKGKLSVKGNLPLRTTEASLADKIDLKCEVLEVRAKNMLSGPVDTQLQVTGSILQPNISGNIKLSHGEAYLPHEKGGGAVAAINRESSDTSSMPSGGYNQVAASKYVSRFLNLKPTTSNTSFQQPSG